MIVLRMLVRVEFRDRICRRQEMDQTIIEIEKQKKKNPVSGLFVMIRAHGLRKLPHLESNSTTARSGSRMLSVTRHGDSISVQCPFVD